MTKRKERKRTNNDIQNFAQKTKDRATRKPLETRNELRCFRRVSSSCSTYDTRQNNDLKKTGKWTNNNLQNITRNWLNYEYVLFLPQRFKVMDLGH